MTFIVFQAITGAFGAFADIYALTGGGAGTRDSFLYPIIYLYSTMFKNGQAARAAAMGYIIAAILFVITSIQRRLFADEEGGNLL
jgi:ABC-type sugar transport system permease subunit